MLGVGMALVFLIGFALVATQLLKITGLVLAGGLLLLWVAYNMYRELRPAAPRHRRRSRHGAIEGPPRSKTFLRAAIQVTLADLSMSLDNVLAGRRHRARAPGGSVHRPGVVGDPDGPRRQSSSPSSSSASAGSPGSACC